MRILLSPVGARRSIPVCSNVMAEVCLGHIQFVIFNYAAKRDGPCRGGLPKDNGSQCARTIRAKSRESSYSISGNLGNFRIYSHLAFRKRIFIRRPAHGLQDNAL